MSNFGNNYIARKFPESRKLYSRKNYVVSWLCPQHAENINIQCFVINKLYGRPVTNRLIDVMNTWSYKIWRWHDRWNHQSWDSRLGTLYHFFDLITKNGKTWIINYWNPPKIAKPHPNWLIILWTRNYVNIKLCQWGAFPLYLFNLPVQVQFSLDKHKFCCTECFLYKLWYSFEFWYFIYIDSVFQICTFRFMWQVLFRKQLFILWQDETVHNWGVHLPLGHPC